MSPGCHRYVRRVLRACATCLQTGTWSEAEVERLRPFFAAGEDGKRSWKAAAEAVGTRGPDDCKNQFRAMLHRGQVPGDLVTSADQDFLAKKVQRQAGINARKKAERRSTDTAHE